MEQTNGYVQHPLSAAFPAMPGHEIDALAADIKANGQREPGIMYEGKILDGWHRSRACQISGVTFTKMELATGIDPVAFVKSRNLHRRHLTGSQRAAAIVACAEWAEAGRPVEKGEVTSRFQTNAEMAAEADVSDRTIKNAKAAQKAGLGDAVKEGRVSADRAAAVAKADPKIAKKIESGKITEKEAFAKPSKILPRPEPPAKIEPSAPEPVADDEDHGPSLSELVDELAEENKVLLALIESAQADDLKAEAIKWRKAYERAVVAQSEAMDSAARSEKREVFNKRQLMRCGKAVGEDDPRKIAAAVEAAVKPKVS